MKKQEFSQGSREECNKMQKRTRKKSSYVKINNETRQKLIEMVYLEDFLLKDASMILNINYSTAKTIMRIFRLEKRILKKNSPDLSCLQNPIQENQNKFQIKSRKKEFTEKSLLDSDIESISHTSFKTNSNIVNNNYLKDNDLMIDAEQQSLNKKIQDPFLNLSAEAYFFNFNAFDENAHKNFKLDISKVNYETKTQEYSQQNSLLSGIDKDEFSDYFQTANHLVYKSNIINSDFDRDSILFMDLSNKIQSLTSMVRICQENLKSNQNLIDLLIKHISHGS